MRKLMMIALVALTLSTTASMPAFAGMNNAVSEDFFDDLPEIEVEESEDTPEVEASEEVVESHEETKTAESEIVPERTVSIRDDVDNTPEHPTRVIYARRNVVICDNEPIETLEEIPETETKETVFEAPETEETTTVETETVPVKVPTTSSSLPKTADFSDLMIAGVAVMVIVAAAFAVVANRRKRA